MKFIPLWILLIFQVAFISGCGDQESTKNKTIDSYVVVEDVALTATPQELSGTGRVAFRWPLTGVNAKTHFHLVFRLPTVGSRLTLFTHFSNKNFNDGVSVEIERMESALKVLIFSPGQPPFDASSSFQNVLQGNLVDLRLEIHDGGPQKVRVLAWTPPYRKITETHALFDSSTEGPLFRWSGQGASWGLFIDNALLKQARRESAYVE